ncbi:integrating conjugative element protein [Vibrio sinensis]|uniref:Integrating conjugative element protein n=1 Tax=Vibrio sinensis TaxID=2302434 RepID=A0A3A6QLM0_9VIBR|nr:integrating conjugative element protein [Vibrio sinensis]RJX68678.1 integrating conjugative element protein [Vibrio sinensis]
MKRCALALALTSALPVTFSSVHAGTDVLHYAIGGGPVISLSTRQDRIETKTLGVGWDMNLQCGLLDPKVTIKNQLNGITDGYQDMMGDMLSNATSAVASLPGYFIQKRDPGLYDMLTNGVLQGKFDFDDGQTSCESITETMAGVIQGSDYNAAARAQAWTQAVKSGDAVKAKETAMNDMGDNGITWVGGRSHGGRNQPPLNAPKDAAIVGFEMLAKNQEVKNREGIYRYWNNADEMSTWLTQVIGSRSTQTGMDKSKTSATAGIGLNAGITKQAMELEKELRLAIAKGQESPHFPQPLIDALVDSRVDDANITRIASELAISHSMEKALHARRALLTGKYEVNLAQHQLAQDEINQAVGLLEKEIDLLKFEAQTRQAIGSRTATQVVSQYQQTRSAQLPTTPDVDSVLLRQQLNPTQDNQ